MLGNLRFRGYDVFGNACSTRFENMDSFLFCKIEFSKFCNSETVKIETLKLWADVTHICAQSDKTTRMWFGPRPAHSHPSPSDPDFPS